MLGRVLGWALNLPALLCLSLLGAVLISCTTTPYSPTTVAAPPQAPMFRPPAQFWLHCRAPASMASTSRIPPPLPLQHEASSLGLRKVLHPRPPPSPPPFVGTLEGAPTLRSITDADAATPHL